MKDSGVSWIGEIPEDWKITKIKYTTKLNGRIGWQGLTSDEYQETGPYLITGTDFEKGKINFKTAVHIEESRWKEATQIQVKNGDLLITKDGTVGKVAIISGLDDKASLNSGVLRIQPIPMIDTKFLYYILISEEFWLWFNFTNSGASTILHLYQNVFDNFSYVIPSALTEQKAIADYLDQQTAKFDQACALLTEEIAHLRTYKKALIYETVTKGLDKTAPLKDSGVDWIGEIPVGWEVSKIKYIVGTKVTDGPHETPELIDEGIPFVSAESVKDGIVNLEFKRGFISEENHKMFSRKVTPQKDDIYIVKSGATTGNIGIVTTDEVFDIWSPLALIRGDKNKTVQKFLYYSLQSDAFRTQVEKKWSFGTQQNIGMGVIEQIEVLLPKDLLEQKIIAGYLDEKTKKINEIIKIKEQQLTNLSEQRKTLIYEVVTGKRRVFDK